jgi:hypothetical protein
MAVVTDDNQRYLGLATLNQLIQARPEDFQLSIDYKPVLLF